MRTSVPELGPSEVTLGRSGSRLVGFFAAVGAIALLAAFVLGRATAPERFFRAYLVSFCYFLSLALGALFFVLVTHLTRAGWSVSLRRIAEAVTWTLLPLGLLAAGVLVGMDSLYEWSHEHAVQHDGLLQHKSPYLNPTFFTIRLVAYFVIWNVIAHYFRRRSLEQDRTGRPEITIRMEYRSAPATILFALTTTFAAFDLLMSLNPHWYSTIFGLYYFSGAVVAFFSFLPIVTSLFQRRGRLLRVVTTEHYHDMGKLMFAFTVFWTYVAFSQYMLIWYGNLPEETIFYVRRQQGQWAWASLALLFGHFVVPFLALLSRRPKRRPRLLILVASWLLVMHWLDLYWLVVPEVSPGRFGLSPLDLLCFVGIGGLFLAAVVWRLGRHELVPVRDPRLAESLAFESA